MSAKCPQCDYDNPDGTRFCGNCAALLKPSEQEPVEHTETLQAPRGELTTGSIFAERYQVIEELGKGGMGKVYKALDKEINAKIALKLIKPEIASDKNTIERFRNELKIARDIAHKNVCRMYDLNKEEGSYYITMEYVSGEDLKSFIKRSEKLTVGKAISIAKQVCDGLAEAHGLGVVHRDLKPSNIMIDREGNVRIMDFGIARSLTGRGITDKGVMIGTPDYMSPEQVEGKDLDQRTDIYSLGVMLYEMVTGRVPFEGETVLSIAHKHKYEAPTEPRSVNSQVTDELNSLILKCLEKDKEKRYQSANDLRVELGNIEKGIPTTDRVVPKRRPLTSKEITVTFGLKKLLIPILALVVITILALIVWRFFPKKTPSLAPKIENSIAVISFRNQTGDIAYDYLCQRAIPELLITNLENSRLFYVATWERMIDLLAQMDEKDVEFIDSDLGFKLCGRGGISSIISGSLTKAGDIFMTDVKVMNAENKELITSIQSKGRSEDSILESQIDELSRKICEGLGIPREKIEATRLRIADVTTSSLEAYEYYAQGADLIWKHKEVDAKIALEMAIQIDPSFASAYRKLAFAYSYLGENKARDKAISKALSLSEQATEKEKLYIETQFTAYQGDFEKCIEGLEEIIKKYPDDKEAHLNLGLLVSLQGPRSMIDLNKGAREFEKILELDPNYAWAYNGLGIINARQGNFNKAIEFLKKYASLSPGVANPYDTMGCTYIAWGKLKEAIASFEKAINIDPRMYYTYWILAYTHALRENYPEAMTWINHLLESDPPPGIQGMFIFIRGFLNLWLGRFGQSLRDLDEAEKIFGSVGQEMMRIHTEFGKGAVYFERGEFELSQKYWENSAVLALKEGSEISFKKAYQSYCLGLLDLRRGNLEPVKKRLEEIKINLPDISDEAGRKKMTYLCNLLEWEISIREGDADLGKLLEVFKTDPDYLSYEPRSYWDYFDIIDYLNFPPPFVRDIVARTYIQKGELNKAISAYEHLITLKPQSKSLRLVHPLNYYRLAKLHEQKGDKAKAKEHYEKFLNLWKDADPGIAEVDDARTRLVRLKSQNP